jgi:glycosyltransferase involved in cell wall biosynthesis
VKILHITDLFAPSIGGAETHVLSLVRERVRRGHEISVATLVKIDGKPSEEIEDIGFRVYRMDALYTRFERAWASQASPYHPPFPDPIVANGLRRIIERERPDAVQAHNWMAYSYLAIKTRRMPPVLWMQHDYSLDCPKKTQLYHRDDGHCPGPSPVRCIRCSVPQYGRAKGTVVTLGLFGSNAALLRRADKVVANSGTVARCCEQATGLHGTVEVVWTFIGDGLVEQANSIPRPDYLPSGDDYILFVGVLGPHKGIFDLLDAYRRLGEGAPPLVVLGRPMADQPTSWPTGTIVRENVPRDEVMAAWKHCRFGVVPSRWEEPRAFVALEASTMGKAVIATNTGTLPEIVLDGKTGILVPPCDPAALAAAMQLLIGDPERTASMGEAARIHAASFSVDVTAQFDVMLEKLVVAHRAR